MNGEAGHIHRALGQSGSVAAATASGRRARAFARLWTWLRQVTGDAAYENYLRANRRDGQGARTLSPPEFYLDALSRRYSNHSRCC
jgi:uncharacterized short protein YbdD (DUF466 family)